MLPEEQEGCRRKSKNTGDQLYIDEMLFKDVKRRKKDSKPCDESIIGKLMTWTHTPG